MKREFLQLAQTYKDQDLDGWWVSEKLDGIRAFWDGGLSRGVPKHLVPWANMARDKREQGATGLWSRYGNVIHAPSDWLDQLPHGPLDGELWLGRGEGMRQQLSSIVKKIEPDKWAWKNVRYRVFDSPPLATVFADGAITAPLYKKVMSCGPFVAAREHVLDWALSGPYYVVYKTLHQVWFDTVEQVPYQEDYLDQVLEMGGEGVVYRNPFVEYSCTRTWNMLKHKPFSDMEVTVLGYVTGKDRHAGRMGSLICRCPGGTVKVSGFTDAERETSGPVVGEGTEVYGPTKHFGVGEIITIKYRELSAMGIPIEARYWRKYE